MKLHKAIAATVRRRKPYHPKVMIFLTQTQSEVEQVMAELGYGSNQYALSWYDVIPSKEETPQ